LVVAVVGDDSPPITMEQRTALQGKYRRKFRTRIYAGNKRQGKKKEFAEMEQENKDLEQNLAHALAEAEKLRAQLGACTCMPAAVPPSW
jgi:predicted RNase H-like nuclease (RuvC/YqgF family)